MLAELVHGQSFGAWTPQSLGEQTLQYSFSPELTFSKILIH
jgi:hypothetical protein